MYYGTEAVNNMQNEQKKKLYVNWELLNLDSEWS